jgi:CBS domain-containing protein
MVILKGTAHKAQEENTMDTVKEVLAAKGGGVFTIRPGASVFEALEVMADKGVGAVLVVDELGKLVGIFSERDYARKLELRGKNARATLVREVMTSEMLGVEPTTTVRECMSLMTARRIRHLPVLDGGKLAGMISIGDVVKTIITEQELMISQQAYMIGQYERSLAGGP